jgi:transcriptional regulator with XRE-family HTH domain
VPSSPTVRKRRLSLALRQLRHDAGLTAVEVARHLSWPQSKITRIENNQWKRPSVRDVGDLLDIYGVTDDRVRQDLISLALEGRQTGWWAEYGDVFMGNLPGLEAEASRIRTFEGLVIPGLLQTPGYAEAICIGGPPALGAQRASVERRVEARMARQRILADVELHAVIDEAALRKHVGGRAVMREQLARIVELAARPNVDIQVMPNSAGAHYSLGSSFVILDFEDDPSAVYVETVASGSYLEEKVQVEHYMLIYDAVTESALSGDEAVAFIGEIIRQL